MLRFGHHGSKVYRKPLRNVMLCNVMLRFGHHGSKVYRKPLRNVMLCNVMLPFGHHGSKVYRKPLRNVMLCHVMLPFGHHGSKVYRKPLRYNVTLCSAPTDPRRCPSRKFECVTGTSIRDCVEPTEVCDGKKDCGDGSDEAENLCQNRVSSRPLHGSSPTGSGRSSQWGRCKLDLAGTFFFFFFFFLTRLFILGIIGKAGFH